jgi:hypothetical protein
MNKVAIALLTKGKTELTKRSVEPLLQPDKFDLFWVDGSTEAADADFACNYGTTHERLHNNVRGGPDAGIVYALTEMLKHDYDFVGIHEQDVLLHRDWWGLTFSLFERGRAEGLEVGAVSARCYEDRLLVQRDGFGVVHNLGSGQILLTREAARIILDNYRTTWSTDNRLIFCQLSGIDIGATWAFRGNEQHLTADWGFDAVLARHGLASLALTPSLATMLDQDIAAQGLKMALTRDRGSSDEKAFALFEERTQAIRFGCSMPGIHGRLQCVGQAYTIFPHQIPGIGGKHEGDWRLKWCQGFGPFVWYARDNLATLEIPVLGPCEVLLGNPDNVAGYSFVGLLSKARITDTHSGYSIVSSPADAGGGILQVPIPSGVSYRQIRVEALTPGLGFYGIRTREPQPWLTSYRFDHSCLPRVAE